MPAGRSAVEISVSFLSLLARRGIYFMDLLKNHLGYCDPDNVVKQRDGEWHTGRKVETGHMRTSSKPQEARSHKHTSGNKTPEVLVKRHLQTTSRASLGRHRGRCERAGRAEIPPGGRRLPRSRPEGGDQWGGAAPANRGRASARSRLWSRPCTLRGCAGWPLQPGEWLETSARWLDGTLAGFSLWEPSTFST
jgi:hypothetical protein